MTRVPPWSGRRAQEALAYVRARGRRLRLACCICGEWIDYDRKGGPRSCSVQHLKSRSLYPELTWVRENWSPAHLVCNQAAGDGRSLDIGIAADLY